MYYLPGTAQGTEGIEVNKIDKVADPIELIWRKAVQADRGKNKCKSPEAEMIDVFLRPKKEAQQEPGLERKTTSKPHRI